VRDIWKNQENITWKRRKPLIMQLFHTILYLFWYDFPTIFRKEYRSTSKKSKVGCNHRGEEEIKED
jgi:hypothetical protein